VVRPLRGRASMRVPSSLKLVVATWIAALVGALAGRALAEASREGTRVPHTAPSVQVATSAYGR
jgi:hypothetical protein